MDGIHDREEVQLTYVDLSTEPLSRYLSVNLNMHFDWLVLFAFWQAATLHLSPRS
jgi:hypothetical protein